MTVIIGAHLDDGRKVMMSDGRSTRGDFVARDDKTKLYLVEGNRRIHANRTALFGVSGDPGVHIFIRDVLVSYMASPEPEPNDLWYRLQKKRQELGMKFEASVLVWLPTQTPGEHLLFHIDSDLMLFPLRERYHAIGSGSPFAAGALNGLAISKTICDEDAASYAPSETDIRVALMVACKLDINCGGTHGFIELPEAG